MKKLFLTIFVFLFFVGCSGDILSPPVSDDLYKEYVEINVFKTFVFGKVDGVQLEVEYVGLFKESINTSSFDVILFRERGILYSHRLMYGSPIKIIINDKAIFFDYNVKKEFLGLKLKEIVKLY